MLCDAKGKRYLEAKDNRQRPCFSMNSLIHRFRDEIIARGDQVARSAKNAHCLVKAVKLSAISPVNLILIVLHDDSLKQSIISSQQFSGPSASKHELTFTYFRKHKSMVDIIRMIDNYSMISFIRARLPPSRCLHLHLLTSTSVLQPHGGPRVNRKDPPASQECHPEAYDLSLAPSALRAS